MSTPDDTDELLASYRRASTADAGRPAAKTREAILAEARAAAARRAPAANDSRVSWRMAAGLAVIGVALLIWRQLPRDAAAPLREREPAVVVTDIPERGVPAVTLEMPAPAPAAAPAPAPATEARDRARSEAAPAAKASAAAESERRQDSREESTAMANMTDRPLAPPPPVIVNLDVREPVPEASPDLTGAQQPFGVARARSETGASRPAVEALVRREFPTLLNDTTPPPGVWIIQDAGGRTLRTGTLAAGESLGSVLTRLQREMPERRLRPFEIVTVRGAQGATVPVGLSRAE
jgi:hypothetical protein